MTSMTDEKTSEPEFVADYRDEEIDDDFLYHLYQGGELLRSNRVVEAKDHLEKAFKLKPKNPRGQNLLGLVYFKLGLFHRAIEIYQELVDRYSDDATLRVNLAMVYFKAEQLDEAERELRRAIDLSPDHKNAHRYLGLVLVRKGETDEAQEHFGKAEVKNIESLIGAPSGDDLPSQNQDEFQQTQSQALADVADQAFREMEENEIPLRDEGPAAVAVSAPGLFSLDGESLLIRCPGRVYCRLGTVSWVEGNLGFVPVNKRFSGEETQHPFDRGERAVVAVEGEGVLRLGAPEGMAYQVLQHGDASGYYLENLVFAFGDTSPWENGRLTSGAGTDLPIFHIRGDAQVVICCAGGIVRRRLDGERRVRLRASGLIGWIGDLMPRLFEGEQPLSEELWIELSGAGEILCLA